MYLRAMGVLWSVLSEEIEDLTECFLDDEEAEEEKRVSRNQGRRCRVIQKRRK